MSRTIHLKIKIRTLADEAHHIRREERKARSREFYSSVNKMFRRADSLERRSVWEPGSEKSLAGLVEAKRLRERAAKVGDETRATTAYAERRGLRKHRVEVVRPAARNCLLAYGYLRGKTYKALEGTSAPDNQPDWRQVGKIVARFGGDASSLHAWATGKEVRRAA